MTKLQLVIGSPNTTIWSLHYRRTIVERELQYLAYTSLLYFVYSTIPLTPLGGRWILLNGDTDNFSFLRNTYNHRLDWIWPLKDDFISPQRSLPATTEFCSKVCESINCPWQSSSFSRLRFSRVRPSHLTTRLTELLLFCTTKTENTLSLTLVSSTSTSWRTPTIQ